MQKAIFFFVLFITVSCANTKKLTMETNKLNGTWLPIQQEIGGTALPKAAFEKQKLVLQDTTYTVFAESVDKGMVNYQGNKMDIVGKEGVNTGKHFKAIYKLENGQLTVCYNLRGDAYPEGFDTKGKPLFFLSVFNREENK